MKKSLLLLSLCTFATAAQGNSIKHLPIDLIGPMAQFDHSPGWRIGAGLGIELENEFHGSDETAIEVEPYLELSYQADDWLFQSNIFSNHFFFQLSDEWFFISRFNYEEGRDEEDASNNILKGMGKIDSMLEIGFGLSWQPVDKLTLSLLGQGYTGGDPDKGLVGFAAAHYQLIDSEKFKLEARFDISFANGAHLQTEFGVTPAQSLTSGYDEYAFESGLKSLGLGLHGVYVYNPNLFITFGAAYESYAGDVPDSPLVKAGNDYEVEASAGFVYKF